MLDTQLLLKSSQLSASLGTAEGKLKTAILCHIHGKEVARNWPISLLRGFSLAKTVKAKAVGGEKIPDEKCMFLRETRLVVLLLGVI